MAGSFYFSGYNCVLSYKENGNTTAAGIRVSDMAHVYGVVSTESQAAQRRAFYPHRRSQGQFQLTADCIHYAEFKQLMSWLTDYGNAVLSVSQGNDQPPPMTVSMPSRNFLRQGVLTTGIDDHDQTASMVFSPVLTFISVADPNDSLSSILSITQASTFQEATVAGSDSAIYYPSTGNTVDSTIFDIPTAQADVLSGPSNITAIIVDGKVKGF